MGDERMQAGLPYQNPKAFNQWLKKNIGYPDTVDEIILWFRNLNNKIRGKI